MENICIPMHLDAFSLSPENCAEGVLSRVAPFTQPNYTALRLDSQHLQHDVLDHTDFHNTQPATRNPRTADIGQSPPGNLKLQRLGVHLQWSLPRLYRTAVASGKDNGSSNSTDASAKTSSPDATQPVFREVPNRWLITRRLKTPKKAPGMSEFQSWVVESDVVQNIKTIADDVDLESDVAPFVSYDTSPSDTTVLNTQTEVFLGQKFDLKDWPGKNDRKYLKTGLTVMSSSNPLFADYALHNCNVLSIIDNFSYKRNPNDQNPRDDHYSYLSNAICDYFVIGWHKDASSDPFNTPLDLHDQSNLTTRLTKLLLKLSPPQAGDNGKFKDMKDPTRCLVHGAVYDVKYDFHQKQGSMADTAAAKFTPPPVTASSPSVPVKMEPLSIGTTPLDGILTFLDAHQKDPDDINAFGPGGKTLSKDIVELSQLLYAAADEYDSRVAAQDLIAQQNFTKADGGSRWTYARGAKDEKQGLSLTNDGKPKIPSSGAGGEIENLAAINEAQLRLEVCLRKLSSLQWGLFAEWFTAKSQFLPQVDQQDIWIPYKARVQHIKELILGGDGPGQNKTIGLRALRDSLKTYILGQQKKVDCKMSARNPFQLRTDPTLCIAGLDSGWPSDVMDTLQVRLESEITTDTTLVDAVFHDGTNPVTQDHRLDTTARMILAQCLKDSNATTNNGKRADNSDTTTNDSKSAQQQPYDLTITGYENWGGENPFAPLFIEWEGIYYHIVKDDWEVKLRPSPVGHAHPQVRYVPKQLLLSDPTNNTKNQNNQRTVSGRVIVLPQPRFSLENVVLQVIDSKSPDIPEDLEGSLDDIRRNIRKMKFISAPLSGLTNHLLTRAEGSHVKPNLRSPGQTVTPLAAAYAPEIGMDGDVLALIDAESALTPYGTLMAFGIKDYPYDPFKPVTHGQMVLTKLNIIDKFGQAVCLPFSNRRRVVQEQPPDAKIYPSLSDYLTPDVIKAHPKATTGILNTVFKTPEPAVDGEWPKCQFIQLTHSINQEARINASFMTQDTVGKTYSPWRECTEYESPIWGWLVVNYADNGLQFFLGDGTFYREIRKGGVQGTNVSAKWLPFDPPKGGVEVTDAGTYQLSKLMDQLSPANDPDGSYLQAFFNMINGAIQNMPFAPSSYSGYANAIIGKPLALVNAGWSIELAAPPIERQFISIDKRPADAKPADKLENYSFPLKIGDYQRTYDGVVGFYMVPGNDSPSPGVAPPQPETDWTTLYTYFPPKDPSTKFTEITPPTYPPLQTYFIDPETELTSNMTYAKNRKYTITAILMDPYTDIHAYSPILPCASLTLPPWTVQTAMAKMHAFFRLGPSLLTSDVPNTYAEANTLDADGVTPKNAVSLPLTGTKGTWSWLQPYVQDGYDVAGNDLKPKFAEMGVLQDNEQIKWQKAPYTLVEGYLELKGRLDAKSGS